uniref:Uncharacterized protein n=1 Tax=Tanacetum cinerariifolium TaxID=118510 RepID=A0A6L2JTI4_TANCI|nr:hypothetical protein [Tanacetum cinerariifolium]
MTSKAQQIELDNTLVILENLRIIGRCNMRIYLGMKPKEPTYQVMLDALALTTCYPTFLITAEVLIIYMHQFWATIIKHKSSYQFKINKKRFYVNVEVFRDILIICLKVPGKAFDEPPTEKEALSFICELGHTREINYITDVIVDHKSDSTISSEESPSKKKSTKAKKPPTKPKPSKKKAPIKADRGKSLNVLSEVALLEVSQIKEATKQSKKDFYISHTSGSGDGIHFESRVPNEKHHKTFGIDEGTGSKPGVPDIPKYDYEIDKESWGNSDEEDDDDEDDSEDVSGDNDDDDDDASDDERAESNRDQIPNSNQTIKQQAEEEEEEYDDTDEEKINDEEKTDKEEHDEVTKELYKDVNVNLGNKDADITHDD